MNLKLYQWLTVSMVVIFGFWISNYPVSAAAKPAGVHVGGAAGCGVGDDGHRLARVALRLHGARRSGQRKTEAHDRARHDEPIPVFHASSSHDLRVRH